MIIAFLDVLSNAMAAILIIAIIQLNPERSDDERISGLFFIKASLLELNNNSDLGMRIETRSEIIFDEDPILKSDYCFMQSEGSTILFVTKNLDEGVRIFIFLKQNVFNYSDSTAISIDVSLPNKKERKVLWILKDTYYEVEIPKWIFQ